MLKPLAFWDSSVLVTLCVNQAPSAQALLFEQKYQIVVWWATEVEVASALAQLKHRQQITSSEYAHAKVQAEGLAHLWRIIAPSTRIASEACRLVELYPLRAADALQLAAALAWCNGQPQGRVFLAFDRQLREAAGLVGFTLE